VDRDRAGGDLPGQRLVRAEQELLTGLPARIEGARDLRAAEGAVRERPAVLARERHALRHALVDDVHAQLGQAIDVGLARAEVPALDGVVEQAPDAVPVVLVVLGGVDPALGGDAVRAARAVVEREARDPVAQLAERGRGRATREPGPDHEHVEAPPVRGRDELVLEQTPFPLLLDRTGRDARGQLHSEPQGTRSQPQSTAAGTLR
jgi:hypothetical protein